MVYPAFVPLMHTRRLPVVDSTDAPADLNGLVRFAERGNLASARVPSYFKRNLHILARHVSNKFVHRQGFRSFRKSTCVEA